MTLNFKIYRNLHKAKKYRAGYISRSGWRVDGNGQIIQNSETTEKGKRSQVILSQADPNAVAWKKRLMDVGELEGRTFKECRVLFSDKGCKEQHFHHKYDPEELKKDVYMKPRIALLALQKDTTLNLYDQELEKVIVVLLERGDCLIFDADALHAGSGYNKVNVRFQAYLDVQEIERQPGKIWPLNNTLQNQMKQKERVTSDNICLGTETNDHEYKFQYYDGIHQQMFTIFEEAKATVEKLKTSYENGRPDTIGKISSKFTSSSIELSKLKRKREPNNLEKLQTEAFNIEMRTLLQKKERLEMNTSPRIDDAIVSKPLEYTICCNHVKLKTELCKKCNFVTSLNPQVRSNNIVFFSGKKCSGCNKKKARSEFHKRSARPCGVRSKCKECVKASKKKYRENNRYKRRSVKRVPRAIYL
jgi:hypothetical protein